jgi:benzoyl-CoA reductase/2-hydroxyglutaryl-CoA dehydratase subunit BcrC/BadD/HgdB
MDKSNHLALKKFAAVSHLKRVMAEHFYELDTAARRGSPKIAWCTSVGPVELLRSMGFLVYFPENHAAMLGASRMATDCIPAATAEGYSPDICSYLTSDIGAFLKSETPLARSYEGISEVPQPDVLVYHTNQCREVKDWFRWYSRKLGVPCLGVENFHNVDEVTDIHLQAISAQLRNLVPSLEEIGGTGFDPERLQETIELARRASDLWKQVLETAVHRPSPLTFFDGAIHMGPAVVARGTRAAVDYYELLLAELRGRISQGVAAIEPERFRLFWDGMPIWGKLRPLSRLFAELGACVVASTYCNSWIFSALDPEAPFDSMARAYTELFIVRSDEAKERYLEEMVELYGVDGLLFHDAQTCPHNSNSRFGMPQRLAQKLGIPALVIHGDLNDLRLFSEEQTVTRIEVFIEQIRGNRDGGLSGRRPRRGAH